MWIDWLLRDCLKNFDLVSFGKIKDSLKKLLPFGFFLIRTPVVEKFSSRSDRHKSEAKWL